MNSRSSWARSRFAWCPRAATIPTIDRTPLGSALSLILAALQALPASAGIIRATVVSISDGDSLRVWSDGRRIGVRLACIDAPELAQEPHGVRARDALRRRLPVGSSVLLSVKDTDRYGRWVAELIGGGNVNRALVEDGMAFAYRRHLHQCDAVAYLDAENRASRRRRGVWSVPGGIMRPWQFRLLRQS